MTISEFLELFKKSDFCYLCDLGAEGWDDFFLNVDIDKQKGYVNDFLSFNENHTDLKRLFRPGMAFLFLLNEDMQKTNKKKLHREIRILFLEWLIDRGYVYFDDLPKPFAPIEKPKEKEFCCGGQLGYKCGGCPRDEDYGFE